MKSTVRTPRIKITIRPFVPAQCFDCYKFIIYIDRHKTTNNVGCSQYECYIGF